jgi:hypothetical protein
MKNALIALTVMFALPAVSMASGAPPLWQSEIISLVSHRQFKQAGEKMKHYCVEKRNGELCLVLASAFFEGEAKFGIESRDVVEACRYTKMACDYGSDSGCAAYAAAIEKGELVQYVLYEPGVVNRDAQLKQAIELGADLNATPMFSRTLLQEAVSEEKAEAVRLLLDNGVDVNYRVGDEDLTPLMYAVNSGNEELAVLLLERGADPGQKMRAPDYLQMGGNEADACDLARKLENARMQDLLGCKNPRGAAEAGGQGG